MLKILTSSVFVLTAVAAGAQIEQLKKTQEVRKTVMDPAAAKTLFTDPLVYVNPFVGTGGHGHTFPGPVMPFGMVQLGPDTRYEGWDGCSGYHYSDSMIYGFSHTHLSGTGVPDYSDLLIVPQVGKAVTTGKFKDPKGGYGATFYHREEIASPGFYKVKLHNPNVDVRLTTTKRCGIHEYTFLDKKGKKYLVLDLGYRDKVIEASASVMGKSEVRGRRISEAWAVRQHFYFDLQTSIPFTKATWVEDKKGTYAMVLEFPESTDKVLVRVGISGTDEEGAAANLQAEAFAWDFEAYMRAAQDAWRTELGVIQAQATDKEILANLYTGLYHAYIHPSLWTDADGRYRDYNQNIRVCGTGDMYSVFSIWDTYRGANPLYTILQPNRVKDFVESYYQQYKDMGTLPVWTLSNNETYCMIGYHAASVIADAAAKGIQLNHPNELLDAMIATANYNHFGIPSYAKNGFISAGEEAESVSKTLEYAYDDWCIAQYARLIGKEDIAKEYLKRSENWRNLYNPESGFFQPREGGRWLPKFVPNEVNHHFTEANAWQYSLAVQHNIPGLIRLKGGPKRMEAFLDSLFLSSSKMSGREQADITGLIGQYAHGNEPSHHMAYLYNYVGAPHKTQQMLDRIQREYYHNAPDGLSGNEDCGQMSAWYVLSSMGIYPVTPGSPIYAIGKPMVDRLSMKTAEAIFAVEVKNNSKQNIYIQSLEWNHEPYKKLYITQDMIVKGGLLTFVMGPEPNPELASYETGAATHSETIIPAPYFQSTGTVFPDVMRVGIETLPDETGKIVYTVNGDEPTVSSAVFENNIVLYNTTTLKARVYREEQGGKIVYGPVVTTEFVKFVQDKTIALTPLYANQYSGGNDDVLIDGQKGGSDYRSIGWQGFQGQDIVALITLNETKDITKVVASCMQDTKSWIFHPESIVVEISEDGINYKKIGTVENKTVSDRTEGVIRNKLVMDFPPVKAKFVRVTVKNYGKCPAWHLGAGGDTWIFMDEITVE